MPYFVFRVTERAGSAKLLEHIASFDKFADAKQLVRAEREKANRAAGDDVRLIFAKSEIEAQTLLKRPRDERVIGED